jgi:hypothetical protein
MNQNIDITQLLQLAAAQGQQKQNTRTGLSYFELLSIVFVIFKFLGYFTLGWFWAFSPIFIPWVFYSIIFLIGFITTQFKKR